MCLFHSAALAILDFALFRFGRGSTRPLLLVTPNTWNSHEPLSTCNFRTHFESSTTPSPSPSPSPTAVCNVRKIFCCSFSRHSRSFSLSRSSGHYLAEKCVPTLCVQMNTPVCYTHAGVEVEAERWKMSREALLREFIAISACRKRESSGERPFQYPDHLALLVFAALLLCKQPRNSRCPLADAVARMRHSFVGTTVNQNGDNDATKKKRELEIFNATHLRFNGIHQKFELNCSENAKRSR